MSIGPVVIPAKFFRLTSPPADHVVIIEYKDELDEDISRRTYTPWKTENLHDEPLLRD